VEAGGEGSSKSFVADMKNVAEGGGGGGKRTGLPWRVGQGRAGQGGQRAVEGVSKSRDILKF